MTRVRFCSLCGWISSTPRRSGLSHNFRGASRWSEWMPSAKKIYSTPCCFLCPTLSWSKIHGQGLIYGHMTYGSFSTPHFGNGHGTTLMKEKQNIMGILNPLRKMGDEFIPETHSEPMGIETRKAHRNSWLSVKRKDLWVFCSKALTSPLEEWNYSFMVSWIRFRKTCPDR